MLCEWGKWPRTTLGVKHNKYATLESLENALKSPMVDLDEVASHLREDLEKVKQGVFFINDVQVDLNRTVHVCVGVCVCVCVCVCVSECVCECVHVHSMKLYMSYYSFCGQDCKCQSVNGHRSN